MRRGLGLSWGRLVVSRMGAVALVLVVAVACGGDDGAASSDDLATPRVALTAPVQPWNVWIAWGPRTYGEEFGVPYGADDIQAFDSHSTAIQAALAGEADIVTGSLLAWALVVNQGEEFKAFCPYAKSDDYVVAGRNGITSLEQLLDPATRVGIDSPGGAANSVLDAIFQAKDIDATVEEIPTKTVLESSSLRESAFAADAVDVTVFHVASFEKLKQEVPDATMIASLPQDAPDFISLVYAARTDWIDENLDTAAAFCASVLKAGRELKTDYDLYLQAVNETVDEADAYGEAALRATWDMFVNYDVLPNDGDMEEESVTFTLDVGVNSGILEEAPSFDQIVDRRPLDAALDLLEE